MRCARTLIGIVATAFTTVTIACSPTLAAPTPGDTTPPVINPSGEATSACASAYIDEHERLLHAMLGNEAFRNSDPPPIPAVTPESCIAQHQRLLCAADPGAFDASESSSVTMDPMPWFAIQHTALIDGIVQVAATHCG